MSYIRATSNPEGLYVISVNSDKTGRPVVELIPGWEYKLTNANNDHPMTVPQGVFDELMKAWENGDHEAGVKHKGFVAREVHVYSDDGSLVTAKQSKARVQAQAAVDRFHGKPMRKTEHMIRVSYRGRWMLLWGVTWAFVVHNATSELRRDAEDRAKARKKRSKG